MTVLIFIGVLLLLIVGHELGHFLTAKAFKIPVLEFGVGFPPKIFGKKFGETEYTVNWMPFGGFVRIFGEDEKEMHDPQAFPNRPVLHQALVLFAGPFANILLAVVLSTCAFMVGAFALIEPEDVATARDVHVLIGEVLPESPAALAGIQPGDRIILLASENETLEPATPDAVSEFISTEGKEIIFEVTRSGETLTFVVAPTQGLIEEDPERFVVGIATALVGIVSYPPHEALWRGIVDTGRDFVFILISLGGLIGAAFTFSADVSNIAGPVGIASLTGDAAALGFGALLSFAAILSVNLAIINLLPFPALDGGRLVFLAAETLSRKKIPLVVAQYINTAGFFILILIMLAVTVGDISRLVG